MLYLQFQIFWINRKIQLNICHPCGSYNNDTLNILKELGIELGFKQIMTIEPEKNMKKINNSFLKLQEKTIVRYLRE